MTAVVDVREVTFSYGERTVLESVSLSLTAGDFVGLVGPNGSGKTTLLRLVLGQLSPDAGRIEVFGDPVAAFEDGHRIGYVPQDAPRKGETMPISVREVVRMGRYPHTPFGRFRAADERAVTEALETTGVADLADRRLSRLSGGQRRRALLARAIAAEADLLVLDEPTVGVDGESRVAFFALLERLNDAGTTILLIEHDRDAVARHADRVLQLNRTLESLEPSALLGESQPPAAHESR